jgi:translation initiation factor IF-3
VPVPRRFDRRPPERDTTRINDRIRVPEVRLIDDQGNQVGVMKTADALVFAQERELDLVEVAPDARPPVCRVLDYSKYKYEQAQKQKAARKHQQQITVREIKFRPKIAEHDYDTKKHHVERFLRHKDKVKVTIMFRGREVTHPERGTAILDRLAEELQELGVVEQRPMQEGRNMTMLMAPSKAVLAGRLVGEAQGEAAAGTVAPEVLLSPNGSAPAAPGEAAAAPAQEAPAGEPASGDAPAEDAPAEEASAGEAPAEEAPAQEAPAQEAPAQEAPAQEAPAQEAPAQEAPAQEVPAQQLPVQDAPAQEVPAEQAESPAQALTSNGITAAAAKPVP